MPPSAITGTPSAAATLATSWTAVICGTPTPATTRVVQIEPGPMPTLTASAPASISARAASAVAMLPATTSTGTASLIRRTISITPAEWPCAVSTTITSTPAATSASTRSSASGPTPTAAPTRSRPCSSFVASGYWIVFWMSLTVIRPRSRRRRRPPAASRSCAVQDLLGLVERRADRHGDEVARVMSAETGWSTSSRSGGRGW